MNNTTILRNTFYLYIRMLVTILVSLYSSRIVLQELGVSDFGIYNVVGGIVLMFGIITNSMASTAQRFFSFEIGRNDHIRLNDVFNTTVVIFLALAFLVLILGESVGLWFVLNKLNIKHERVQAAVWVYHFSLLSFFVTILRIPFNAMIIAYEKMGFYAWSSVVEVVLKLGIVFILIYLPFDKLILYSILTFVVILSMTLIYGLYCFKRFSVLKFKNHFERKLFASVLAYSGWSTFDSISNIAKNQGVNVLLNIFFNTTVNAARSVAFQVNTQLVSLVGNLQIATAPRLTKLIAAKEYEELKELYFQSSRLSFFLLFFISLPVFLELEQLLSIWLVNVPDYTLSFTRLILLNSLVDSLAGTTNIVVQATGKIRLYQIASGSLMFLNLPISYLFLKFGFTPETTFFISIGISFLIVATRLMILQYLMNFKVQEYLRRVVIPSILAAVISMTCSYVFYSQTTANFLYLIGVFLVSCSCSLISFGFVATSKGERSAIFRYIKSKIISVRNR